MSNLHRVLSVREMIDSTFGSDLNTNYVNFRLLETILHIIANQLRILERKVEINGCNYSETRSDTTLKVSEIKIHAQNEKKKKKKGQTRTSSFLKMGLPPRTTDPNECIPEGAVVCKSSKRADSQEEAELSPAPMRSLRSIELQQEKLLVVERVSSKESRDRKPRVSVVTQEQFNELLAVVQELQAKFNPMGTPGFPDNAELMQALRKGASLSDAMAALQLSARLEAAEKMLLRMISLITDLVRKTPGLDVSALDGLEELLMFCRNIDKSTQVTRDCQDKSSEPSVEVLKTVKSDAGASDDNKDYVTYEELDIAMNELHDDLVKTITKISNTNTTNANTALKTALRIEEQLSQSSKLEKRMADLDMTVTNYAQHINAIDTSLSSQISNFQEQLSQMQFDLEAGLDNLTEVLASSGADPAVIAELNVNFNNLQQDLETSALRQKELEDFQGNMALDLTDIWKQLELIRDAKADRDEVIDVLRDKAGITDLNGMVDTDYFNAVYGDIEHRFRAAYEKFNNQELVWQKAIEDLLRAINDKVDWIQIDILREDINKNLNLLQSKINTLLEVVGEPRAAITSRILFRDTNCISCSTPAKMNMKCENIPKLPSLPKRSPGEGVDAIKTPGEDGDHGICYPGLPIPHPRDPRSHVCQRYCGGSHTKMPTVNPTPQGMIMTPLPRRVSTTVGTDGKCYQTEEQYERKPCTPCAALKRNSLPPAEDENEKVADTGNSGSYPSDFLSRMEWNQSMMRDVSVSNLPPLTDDD